MPELDIADGEGTGRGDTILVSVPPPEGVVVATALRERGFTVGEVPLAALAARVLAEAPRVMVVDVDAVDVSDALDAIERARAASGTELFAVGDPTRAAELGAHRDDGRVFERPIDVEALVLSVVALAEPAGSPRETMPPSFSRARETSPPAAARLDSEAPPPSEYPGNADPLDILPSLDEEEGPSVLAPIELSRELLQILDAAEQRVNAQGRPHPSSIPSPEDEQDLLLPPDLLASLDEPLDPDDDLGASGAATGGTGYLRARTGGETGTTGSTTGSGTGAAADHPGGRSRASFDDVEGGAVDRGAGTGLDGGDSHASGSGSRSSAPPTAAISVALSGVGPESSPFAGDAPASSEVVAPSGVEGPRPVRIGVVPIPMEPIPDRPVPDPSATFAGPPSRPEAEPAVEAVAEPEVPRRLLFGEPRAPVVEAPEAARGPAPEPARRPAAPAAPAAPPALELPAVLGPGDAMRALATAIAARASGSLALGHGATLRRIVLHEGDIVTAASGSVDETLVAFLTARGDFERDVGVRLAGKLPAQGRHAGAALIAHGHLGQDDLWPVLRAHAEWLIGRALVGDEGTCELEDEPPGRLKAEPNVFGGATGAEVLLEQIRRVVPPELAARRLGGPTARLAEGPRRQLLGECALRIEDEQIVRAAAGRTVGEVLAHAEPELADVVYGFVSLGVLEAFAPVAAPQAAPSPFDPLDEEALRQRVRARLALVEDGDYFALLGIPRGATGYEIRRAYVELRRAFEPGRVLTAATADLAADVRLVVEVIDEAYDILREPHRRDRYRRAIEAGPP